MAVTRAGSFVTSSEKRFGTEELNWLVTDGATLMATTYVTSGPSTWEPWLKSVGRIRSRLNDTDAIPVVSSVIFEVVRNATTDAAYLVHTAIGRSLDLVAIFDQNTTNSFTFNNLLISRVEVVDQSTLSVACVIDESIFVDIPFDKLGERTYDTATKMVKGISFDPLDVEPIMLGEAAGNASPEIWQNSLEPIGVGVKEIGKLYDNGGADDAGFGSGTAHIFGEGLCQTTVFAAAEYLPDWDLYTQYRQLATGDSLLHAVRFWKETPDTAPSFIVGARPSANIGSLSSRSGEGRILAAPMTAEYADSPLYANENNCLTWEDLPEGVAALDVDAGQDRLALMFAKPGGQPADFKSWTNGGVILVFEVTAITGTLKVYKGTASTDARGTQVGSNVTTTGVKTFTFSSGTWDVRDWFMLLELSVATKTASISNIYMQFRYRAHAQNFITKRVWETDSSDLLGRNSGTTKNRTGRLVDTTVATSNVVPEATKMLFGLRGPNATIQPGATSYTFDTPQYCLYYLLVNILGFASGSVDGTSWDNTYAYLVTDTAGDFNDWDMGRSILNSSPSLTIIDELCSRCGLIMFRSWDDKMKLAVLNHIESVAITFTEESAASPMWDFEWGYTENFYNDFEFRFRWDPARSKFSKRIVLNRGATVSSFLSGSKTLCTNANTNYGRDEILAPVDCHWFPLEAAAENYAKIVANWATFIRRWVRFKTKISMCHLEIGDGIRTDHSSQTWTDTAVDFQVRGVTVDPATASVTIEAMEVNEI